MTFEEWWEAREDAAAMPLFGKSNAQAAWYAGYQVGMNDVPTAEYEPPEGYVVVPLEPTEAIVEEGEIAYVHGGTIDAVYKAMIQAAQEEE